MNQYNSNLVDVKERFTQSFYSYVVVESMIMIGVTEMCVFARAIGNLSRTDDSGYLGI